MGSERDFHGVKAGERIDDIGFGGLRLIQQPEEFCYGVDAVLLADFAAAQSKNVPESIVDLGSGSGVIPLILCHKTTAQKICGVEVQREAYERALRNAKLNDLCGRLSFVHGDVNEPAAWGSTLKGKTDMVVSNPPYFRAGGGIKSSMSAKAIARHETSAGLEDFMQCAAYLLKERGDMFMVHRPHRLADICCFGREAGLELKEIKFVRPDKDSLPNILLAHLVKGGGRELKIMQPLAVYDKNGNYTKELLRAYEKIK